MAKLDRKNFKLFAEDAATSEVAQIGSLRAGAPLKTKDIDQIQALQNYKDGWFGIAIGENSPAMEDMNAIQYLQAYMIAMILGSGVAEWNQDTEYSIGSIINVSGNMYVSLQDSNINHPFTETAWWYQYGNKIRTMSASGNISPLDNYVRANGVGLTLTLPSVAITPLGQKITIKNVTSSPSDTIVTIATTGGQKIDKFDTVTLTAAASVGGSSLLEESITLISNGTRWEIV